MALFDDVSQLAKRLQDQAFGQQTQQSQGYRPPQQSTLQLDFGASQNQPAQTATDRQFHPQTQATPQGPLSTQLDYLTPRRVGSEHAFIQDTYQGSDIDEIRRKRVQIAQEMNNIVTTEGRTPRYWELKDQERQLGEQIAQLRAGRMAPAQGSEDFYNLGTSSGPIPVRPGATHRDINTPMSQTMQRTGTQAAPKTRAPQPPTQNVPKPSPVQAGPRNFTPPSPQVGYTSSKDMRNIVSNLSKLTGGA